MSRRHRLQSRGNGVLVNQQFFGNPVHVRERDPLDGFNVFIGRGAALGGQSTRPDVCQAGDRIPFKLRGGDLAANGRRNQILRDTLLRIACQD